MRMTQEHEIEERAPVRGEEMIVVE